MTTQDLITKAQAAKTGITWAQNVYADAVLAALDAGVPASELAAGLGVSRQAVYQLVKRHTNGGKT